jgi:hypothetical protein
MAEYSAIEAVQKAVFLREFPIPCSILELSSLHQVSSTQLYHVHLQMLGICDRDHVPSLPVDAISFERPIPDRMAFSPAY